MPRVKPLSAQKEPEIKIGAGILKRFGEPPYKLNVGCGHDLQDGYVNMDIIGGTGVLKHDCIYKRLPFPDRSCDEIYTSHFMEHVEPKKVIDVMNEFWRVLKPGGYLRIRVPMYPSIQAFQDPTHVSFWTQNSIPYYVKGEHLHEEVGESYGIKGWSWYNQAISNGWELNALLKK